MSTRRHHYKSSRRAIDNGNVDGNVDGGAVESVANPAPLDYENIVFEGGGVHGIGYVGCIAELERRQLRAKFKRFAGASIGTLMAVAMACRVPSDILYEDSLSLTNDIVTGGSGCVARYRRFANVFTRNRWGLYDLSVNGRQWLERLMTNYIGTPRGTLSDIYRRFGADVHLAVYNRTRSRPEIFSRLTMPDVPVVDMLLATLSFPAVFTCQPVGPAGDLYIDGGITNNCPIYLFDEDNIPNPRTLAIRSISDTSVFFAANVNFTPPPPTSLEEHLLGVISAMVESGQQRYEKPHDADRTYFMKVPHRINSLDFNIPIADKALLYLTGQEGLCAFLDSRTPSSSPPSPPLPELPPIT
jgi:predicted acylesterase/phospholipase RssA